MAFRVDGVNIENRKFRGAPSCTLINLGTVIRIALLRASRAKTARMGNVFIVETGTRNDPVYEMEVFISVPDVNR